ncbi:hypothetical protein V8F20_007648 [Naviculisporaceae sp. PSN 640]
MLQSTISAIFLLAGLAVAAPAATTTPVCKSEILCIDGINECGIRFGDCFDVCNPAARPTPPPCPPTTAKPTTTTKTTITTPLPNIIKTTKTTTLTKATSTCNGSGGTVCWDAINACGMMYGSCFRDCKPWPTPTPPPCPTTTKTTAKTTTTTATTKTTRRA